MKQPTAPPGLVIKVVTGCVLTLNVGLYIAAFYQPTFLWVGIFVSLIVLGCYFFWAPVSYELADNTLTVSFRIGRVCYRPVVRCTLQEARVGFGLRLCGNGGVFAGSGIFWSRKLGLFRGYVTTNRPGSWVLVETAKTKILISPANPRAWLAAE